MKRRLRYVRLYGNEADTGVKIPERRNK